MTCVRRLPAEPQMELIEHNTSHPSSFPPTKPTCLNGKGVGFHNAVALLRLFLLSCQAIMASCLSKDGCHPVINGAVRFSSRRRDKDISHTQDLALVQNIMEWQAAMGRQSSRCTAPGSRSKTGACCSWLAWKPMNLRSVTTGFLFWSCQRSSSRLYSCRTAFSDICILLSFNACACSF